MFAEVIIICALVIVIGWNKGVKDWFEQFEQPVLKEVDISGINSPNAILMQARGGKILGEINGDEQIYPASMTKIMTVIVAIENLKDLDEEITLTDEMFAGLYEQDATQAGFQPGENVRVIDLLYGAMLPSGAECCIALADTISGSEADFAELMNKKARKLGMENTHFCDSTGLHNPDHYSTVKDIAVLMKYCIKNDTFREIVETSRHSTGVTNIHPDGITYYSTMFKNLSDPTVTGGKILGGKTGYTSEAGHCLASFAEIEGREYIFVSAGASGAGISVPAVLRWRWEPAKGSSTGSSSGGTSRAVLSASTRTSLSSYKAPKVDGNASRRACTSATLRIMVAFLPFQRDLPVSYSLSLTSS